MGFGMLDFTLSWAITVVPWGGKKLAVKFGVLFNGVNELLGDFIIESAQLFGGEPSVGEALAAFFACSCHFSRFP